MSKRYDQLVENADKAADIASSILLANKSRDKCRWVNEIEIYLHINAF